MFARSALPVVTLLSLLPGWPVPAAHAQENSCKVPGSLSVQRRLRQLSLDLLGRPPTVDEYQAAATKGSVDVDDIRQLMTHDEFYARMKDYHRALLLSNVSAAVYDVFATVSEGADGIKPLELKGISTSNIRGNNGGSGCDHYILQKDCNTALREDPHAEPATKTCYDPNGVPLPVSYDYDTLFFQCDQLDKSDKTISDCGVAVTKAALPDKLLYFCDMRRDATGLPHPFRCLPNPDKTGTQGLVQEVLEPATGRVVAFVNPNPPAGATDRLDRCSLDLTINGGIKGSYSHQKGCIQREGYVMTAPPFWDNSPGKTQVAACAVDAQERLANPATLESCTSSRFMGDRSCGCGPRFRRCELGGNTVHAARVAAINEEPLLIADSVLRRDEDYYNLLTTPRSFVNGPLSEIFRYDEGAGQSAVSAPVNLAALPEVTFGDATVWKEYLRGPQASGVLTTPGYLLRFPTQRARVNEFYDAFLCKTFAPPAEATLPSAEDACNRENNLAKRCGCNYCHATIEPVGAHWGRYGERNASYLDPAVYARFDPRCRDCALAGNTTCDGQCGNYVMQAYDGDGANSLGLLKTYLYRSPTDEVNIEGGPRMLVERMLQTGDMQRCTVKRVWKEFLGRAMSSEEETLYLPAMVKDFDAGGHRMKDLVQRLLTTDAYWRID